MLSFYSCERVGGVGKEVGGVEGEGRGTGKEWKEDGRGCRMERRRRVRTEAEKMAEGEGRA